MTRKSARLRQCPSRVLAVLATCAAVLIGAAVPAGAAVVVATNTKDGSSIFKLAFDIKRVAGPVVDNTNAAIAIASCTDCTTVAIAIEVVIVTGDPNTFTPTNVAVAANIGCNLCDTFASAIQYVVDAGGPVRFTPEGKQALADLRKQLRDLKDSGLTGQPLQDQLTAIYGQLRTILTTDLVAVPAKDPNPASTSAATTAPTASPSGSATSRPTSSSSATPTSSSSSTPTPTATASSTP
ncbi:MAG: hypothetical protein M3Z02_02445 [Actinomycetota bacterium]|nr:hypothetical protein [Actinomycetota bacterium]